MKRALTSLSISFGVVPDEIRLWKPETAPQAVHHHRLRRGLGLPQPDLVGHHPEADRQRGQRPLQTTAAGEFMVK
jgi:hypothetical protein